MLKIVIEDFYTLYKNGMELMLENIFHHENAAAIEMLDFSEENISVADVIIKYFHAGESYICHSALKRRKPQSLLIGLYDGEGISSAPLPLCLKDTIFLHRSESITKVKRAIVNGWQDCSTESKRESEHDCQRCKHRTLSPQQIKVAAHFYRGEIPALVGDYLDISPKTVGAHKCKIMSKFNLHSDYELLNFLHQWLKQKQMKDLFQESQGIRTLNCNA